VPYPQWVSRLRNTWDGEIGDSCLEESDCATYSCYRFTTGFPGTCTCNTEPRDEEGCPGELDCANPFEAQGIVRALPDCYLHVGDLCDDYIADFTNCLTGNCGPVTGKCTCNGDTDYPCNDGEGCVIASGGVYACVEIGDGSIGSACVDDEHCNSGHCYFGYIPDGSPGTCTCNPLDNAGCEGENECASSDDLVEAQGIYDQFPGCYLPVSAACNYEEATTCITDVCKLSMAFVVVLCLLTTLATLTVAKFATTTMMDATIVASAPILVPSQTPLSSVVRLPCM